MTSIIAATSSKIFIKLPPIRKIRPISQNKTIKPPSHLRKVIFIPPSNVNFVAYILLAKKLKL